MFELENIDWNRISEGVNRYLFIKENFENGNILQNDFQVAFNHYYRVRRNLNFRQNYFNLLNELNGQQNVTFEQILRGIYLFSNSLEPSFSSKLLHTLNNDFPIYDSIVRDFLQENDNLTNGNYNIIGWNNAIQQRIQNKIEVYNNICNWYNHFLNTNEAVQLIQLFDGNFPNNGITNIKKIDFIIWGSV